jgi:hypothetical protein
MKLLFTATCITAVILTKEFVDGDWMSVNGEKNKNFVACMDGSMPAYYIKLADTNSDSLPRKWLIYFEDGPICYD